MLLWGSRYIYIFDQKRRGLFAEYSEDVHVQRKKAKKAVFILLLFVPQSISITLGPDANH